MTKLPYDDEELNILDSVEDGEFESVDKLQEAKQRYQQIAADTMNKSERITIRLNKHDLSKLKAKAVRLGIPYQTLIGAALHQFAKKDGIEA